MEEAYNGLITPDSGVFLHGLFLDAAEFDTENGLLKDALPGNYILYYSKVCVEYVVKYGSDKLIGHLIF